MDEEAVGQLQKILGNPFDREFSLKILKGGHVEESEMANNFNNLHLVVSLLEHTQNLVLLSLIMIN